MNEELDMFLMEYAENMEKAIAHYVSELDVIRVGRANPKILDKIVVDYYGTPTPINQMANISVPEARMMLISVWDISQVKPISKAIEVANLGINPTDDGKIIRLVFPALTQEKRKEVVKDMGKLTESAKVACRNARRDVLDQFKKLKKDSEITEDEYDRLEKEVQKSLDSSITKIEKNATDKEKELMSL